MTYRNFLHEYRPGIEYHANLRKSFLSVLTV